MPPWAPTSSGRSACWPAARPSPRSAPLSKTGSTPTRRRGRSAPSCFGGSRTDSSRGRSRRDAPAMRRPAVLTLLLVLVASTGRAQDSPDVYLGGRMPFAAFDRLPADRLVVPGGEITVAVAPGALEVPRAALLAWIQQSAGAVAGYYGRFPAERTRLLVVPGSGRAVSSGR